MTPQDDPLPALPKKYMDFGTLEGQAALRDRLAALTEQHRRDIDFALAAGIIVLEGPWDDLPAQQVAYIGITEGGQREALPAICNAWRFNARRGDLAVRLDGILPVRIQLGRAMQGLVMGRPQGHVPVQAHGVVDGSDYYFRSRGEHWSLSIGGDDPVASPDWYYEERYGIWPEAGYITEDQAYQFIGKAVALYRSGEPTMTEKTADAGSASITNAIKAMSSTDQK